MPLCLGKLLSNSEATFNLENVNLLSNPNDNPQIGVAYKKTCMLLSSRVFFWKLFWIFIFLIIAKRSLVLNCNIQSIFSINSNLPLSFFWRLGRGIFFIDSLKLVVFIRKNKCMTQQIRICWICSLFHIKYNHW